MYDAEQQSEQTGKLDANGKLTITIPTKFDASNKRHDDQDYTIEAGVTDAANREITVVDASLPPTAASAFTLSR